MALVTGAASGIGQTTAGLLAERGHRVLGVDVDARGLAATARSIGESFVSCVADVGTEEGAGRAVAAAAEHGKIGALINVAGIRIADDRVDRLDLEQWDRVLRVNLTSIFLLSRSVIPEMRKFGGGVIINTASVHAFATMPGYAVYAASKGGVVALTRAMALDHAADGIRVVAVAPGSVDTPMSWQGADRPSTLSVESSGAAEQRVGVGRMGAPREIAEVICWLCSGSASFLNGSTVVADSALSARLGTSPG